MMMLMRSDADSTVSEPTPTRYPGASVTAVPAVGTTAGSRQHAPSGIGYLVVLATREDNGGLMTELEAVCGPGAPGVEERSFDAHEVRFEVLEGRLTVGVEGEAREIGCGSALNLAPGTPHRIWVEPGRAPARFTWQMRPAAEGSDLTHLVFGERSQAAA
jgi:quercetin dioxygenase-like cupin family protein